jgi:hypothetical protein
MLKRIFLAVAFLSTPCLAADPVAAPPARGVALGLGITGAGAGLSISAPEEANATLEALLGETFGGHVLLNLDMAFASKPLAQGVTAYAGPGLTVHGYHFGPRIPVGIQFAVKSLQLGGELAPTVLFGPGGAWGYLDAAIYARMVL